MNEELESILENDDDDNLQKVIAMGTPVDFKFPITSENRPDILKSKPTLISFAAFYKAENCVNFLIQNAAIITLADSDGRLPIHFAAAGGSVSIILIFQEVGVDYSVRDKFALTSIHYAAKYGQIQALKLLWANGAASLDDKAYTLLIQSGVTPLHLGAENGFIDVVDFLIENGCKIDFQTNEGLTPLHYAIKGGKIDMVKYLIQKGADIKITDIYGKTCSQIAIESGYPEIANLFIEENEGDKITLLFDSSENENITLLTKLLDEGIDPNSENDYGQTPIHLAVKKKKFKAVQLLIDFGADVDWEDKGRNTPLHIAVENQDCEMVRLLLENGADIDIKNVAGKSPLDIAEAIDNEDLLNVIDSF